MTAARRHRQVVLRTRRRRARPRRAPSDVLGEALAAQRRRRAVPGIPRERADQPGRRPHPQRRVRHLAGLRPARGGRARRPATPMPANCPRPRCAAPRPAWRRSPPGHSGTAAEPPRATNARLYSDANPLGGTDFAARTALLAEIDAYARGKDPRVKQVMASIAGEWQAVQIMRADGTRVADLRPLVRLNVVGGGGAGRPARDRQLRHRRPVRLRHGDRRRDLARRGGRGAAPGAGQPRQPCRRRPARWRWCSAPAGPASCCTRRSATGWRATSTARRPRPSPGCWASASPSPGVTVVDDGTLPDRRGSLTVDDEGTPTSRTVLIEDGILVGFMQDRLNARLMGMRADRQRPPAVLRPRADAADDQHRHAGRHATRRTR